MNILISGGTGFIGTALCQRLQGEHHLMVLSRNPHPETERIRYIQSLDQLPSSQHFDAVVNLAGEPIADKRWSVDQKQRILDSRINTTQAFIDYFARAEKKPEVFISGSAIGYYGIDDSDDEIDEKQQGDNSFSSKLCELWEKTALQARPFGIRTCLLRTGIVLGKNGGALSKMITPFKFGLGGKMGDGDQWMPWIHLDDLIGIIELCLNDPLLDGPINGTAPNPVTNAQFTKALGQQLHRPTFMSMPAIALKTLMGEMGQELLLSGKKVIPAKAEDTGYQFQHRQLDSALANILN